MNKSVNTNSIASEIKTNQKTLIDALAYIYFSALIIAMMIYGPSIILYLSFAFLATLFILPNREIFGLSLIIVLTMFFERYFTLQGLVIDKSVLKFYLIDIVFCLSFIALIINRRFQTEKSRVITLGVPEKILLIWLILVGLYFVRGIFDINASFDLTFSSFKNYFFYPLLYFFVIFAVDNEAKFKKVIHLILLTAVGLIGFILYGFGSGNGLWTEFTPLSTVGTRYLAGTHAFYLSLAGAMALPLLLYGRLRNKSVALFILALWLLGIAGSLMRHLWLAVAVGLGFTMALLDSSLRRSYASLLSKSGLFVTTVLAVIILTASLLYFQGTAEKIYQDISAMTSRIASVSDLSEDSSATWRQDVWSDAKKIWTLNPILGVGFGHVMIIDSGTYQSVVEIRNTHNSLLAIMVQMGLIGIIVFLLFIASVVLTSFQKIYLNNDLKPYYLGLIAALIVFLVACIFQPYLETNLMSIWLWLILGLLRTASIYEDSANK